MITLNSIRTSKLRRQLAAVTATAALLATACGGAAETETLTSEDFGPVVAAQPAVDRSSSADTQAADGQPIESQPAPAAVAAGPSTDVLAYAVEAAEDLSYSFEQGVSMQMSMMGQEVNVDDVTIATGVVSDGNQSINIDIGTFMVSMMESMGVNMNDPVFAGAFEGFDGMGMDMWVVDDHMVMDLSDMANTMGELDPMGAQEFAAFADGPVSIDLDRLAELGMNDIATADIANQFGQGAQAVDPADLVQMLRSVDALAENGADTVNGYAVNVYSGTMSLGDYSRALGQDPVDQLGQLGDLGLDGDALLASLDEIEVDLDVMIDEEGLVRKLDIEIDMTDFMTQMLAEMGEASLVGDISMVMGTWQTFDQYGEDFDIVAPAATDVTSELAGLMDS